MKKILLSAVAAFSVLSVSAQNSEKSLPKEEYLSTIHENWFLGAGVGAEFNAISKKIETKNPELVVPTFARFYLQAGKWVNPYLAFRASAAYTPFNIESVEEINQFIPKGQTTADGHIIALGVDVMFNLSNMIGGYKPERVYSAKPFVGIDANYAFPKGDFNDGLKEWFVLIGINNEFKVSNTLSVNAEIAAGVTHTNRYGEQKQNSTFVYPIRTSVGVTYYLNRGEARNFRKAVPSDSYYALYADNESLNKEVAKLRKANAKLKQSNTSLGRDADALKADLAALRAQQSGAADEQLVIAPVAVFFDLNSSDVKKDEIARLRYIAKILKEQPVSKFVVEGYADSDTGNADSNLKLSQNRAAAICDVLVDKYGVNRSQLEPVGKGETGSLFDEDVTYNRAVVISTAK